MLVECQWSIPFTRLSMGTERCVPPEKGITPTPTSPFGNPESDLT